MKVTHYLSAAALIAAIFPLPAAAQTRSIHAAPTGMEKWRGLPILAALLRREPWVAEVVYFPIETEPLTAARAFEPVPGMTPDGARMEGHFRRLLNARAGVA